MYQQQKIAIMYPLLCKKQKAIAWFLFCVFYVNLFAPLKANAYTNSTSYYSTYYSSSFTPPKLSIQPVNNKQKHISKPEYKNAENEILKTTLPNIVKAEAALANEQKQQIGGPGQPEMASFKSVGSDNMVNPFTGDFSYNIPLLDVGGYPVNIFYNAGIGMEQESSWTGLGWNLNPGTINRNMRGLPDDFNGQDKVEKEQSVAPEVTVGVTAAKGKETMGKISFNKSIGIKWNSKRGVSLNLGLKAGIQFSIAKELSKSVKEDKTTKDSTWRTISGILSGGASAGLNLNSADGFSGDLNFNLGLFTSIQKVTKSISTTTDNNSVEGVKETKIESLSFKTKNLDVYSVGSSLSFARPSYMPTVNMPISNYAGFLSLKFGPQKKFGKFKNLNLEGFLSKNYIQKKDKKITKPAYGFMYYDLGQNDADGLMDFNRLNDKVYSTKTPTISAPVYTYDVFTINGEGTGGSFRGYRGSVGYVKDAESTSKSISGKVHIELGAGNIFHAGTSLGGSVSKTMVREWGRVNALKDNERFVSSQGKKEGFYFKNPNEMAIIDEDFYNKVGKDKLIRPIFNPERVVTNGITSIESATPILASKYQAFNNDLVADEELLVENNKALKKEKRDKRTQVISFLTAEEAAQVGLDKNIWAYTENMFLPSTCTNSAYKNRFERFANTAAYPRKKHHISEITVLEGDSKRYIYGLPTYTKIQKEVSFSTNPASIPDNKNEIVYTPDPVNYSDGRSMPSGDNSIENGANNSANKEKFFQSQKITNFAHGFMLTAILSPDYVDVTGDGITDDDLGTAVKFNYSTPNITGVNSYEDFKWRYPSCTNPTQPKASYNPGLLTDYQDDKANYTYGSKELWYVHSIESKNMVATFRVSKRKDGLQATGENGGTNDVVAQRKLDRIDLYTKADYNKNPQKAKPIKSVFFEYDYSLCGNYILNDGSAIDKNGGIPSQTGLPNINASKGKLTLKKIWFTYNGSNRKSGEYVFQYAGNKTIVENGQNVVINNNPDYNTAQSDRWANYKPAADNNPAGLANIHYPFAVQNTARANAYASTWNLEKILLPSGSILTVDYESDTYGFVQDRRATVATKIVGFGQTNTSVPNNQLYESSISKLDSRFVFFEANEPNLTKQQIFDRYLKGIDQLLLKLWVEVPGDFKGSGYEPIFVYSSIIDYGPVTSNPSLFYVELTPIAKTKTTNIPYGSPIMQTVLDYVRRNLPSKIHPGYDHGNDFVLLQIVKAIWGLFDRIVQAATGLEYKLKISNKLRYANLDYSFARLNAPNAIKYGGGYRVKKITIQDNWNKISKVNNNEVEKESFYGQEYFYDTKELIGSAETTISSGVATYEPGVGGEENPFREILRTSVNQFLAPTRFENTELPIAETFFPSPMIGYGKVTIKSINRNKPLENIKIKSAIGKQVKEFYTSKDFPVITDYTSFDHQSKRTFNPSPLVKLLRFKQKDLLTLTQGFRVVLNDMNGKPKADYSYPEGDDVSVINSTKYFYRTTKVGENKYRLNNVVPVLEEPNATVTNKLVGKDVEVMNDSREHYSFTRSGTVPVNADAWNSGIFMIVPTIFKMVFKDESMFRSYTTMKVVNEYGILERIETNDKGSIVSTENQVYDAETGGVLISKTNNEFKKPIYNFNYPAHWADRGMALAYRNIDVTYSNVLFRNGKLESSEVDMSLFESGDELYVSSDPSKGPIAAPGCNGGACITLTPSNANRIWAVDLRKDPANSQTTPEYIFIDRYGQPYNGAKVYFRIIRSGHRNLVGATVGSIVSQNNPIDAATQKLLVNNNSNVINASAVLLKEKWKGQDMFYTTTAWTDVVRKAPLRDTVFYPISIKSMSKTRWPQNWLILWHHIDNSTYANARQYNGGPNKVDGLSKTWMNFNLSNIVSSSIILDAKLSLMAHGVNHSHTSFIHDYGSYPNNDGLHTPPHYHYNPHKRYVSMPNDFFVTRMASEWPAFSNKIRWEQLFEQNLRINPNSAYYIPATSPFTSVSNKSYTDAQALPVTNIVRQMILDRDNPSKNYITGFRIEMPGHYPSKKERWLEPQVCFDVDYSSNPVAPKTFLKIKYYNCSEAYGLPGNPTTPPVGQATVDCISRELVTTCHSVFTKQFMNPYVQGILGNWRAWRSYVFYGDRRENELSKTLANNATDIANNGIIKDFVPYWEINQTQNKIEPTTNPKWVWNSQITQYNRKGAQLEDNDALNRYNAAIYGYQETLPIATVNNSRLRQSAFDGFEDYSYKDDACEPYCKPAKVHFKTGITESMLDDKESHTGKYSYKLQGGGNPLAINLPISPDNTTLDPNIRIDVAKTTYNQTSVTLDGHGASVVGDDNGVCLGNMNSFPPIPDLNLQIPNSAQNRSRLVTGKLVVDKSGLYDFRIWEHTNDYVAVYFDNEQNPTLKKTTHDTRCGWPGGNILTASKYLTAGQVYTIAIRCFNYKGGSNGSFAGFRIYWKKQCSDIWEVVPKPYLYLANEASPTPIITQGVCYTPQQIQATANATIDGFDLIPGKKMVASVWVKKGGQDCKCTNYTGINLNINTGQQSITNFVPKSKIIEGWQLFESEFDVPANMSSLTFEASSDNGTTFYLDDLRIHPFNANMKSFVFDPQNLRLSSELDENNYASFYEYDDEGTLVRVKKETKEGIKTIKETRSAVQGKIKEIQ